MTPRIVSALDNVHMGMAHDGLREIARKYGGVNLDTLDQGELVLFLNRARNRLKVIGSQGQVLAYVRLNGGRKLPLAAIQYIPETFTRSGRLDIDAAIATHVKKAFDRKSNKGRNVFVMNHSNAQD